MKRRALPVFLLIGALALTGATALLPARIESVARAVEQVRGKKFERAVPASEIDQPELKRLLRSKLTESFPAPAEETLRTLVAFGFIRETPRLVDRLIDFYASQVIAFYDPEPRRFYVVRGAKGSLEGEGTSGLEGMAEKLIFAHELTHALQDETLKLDSRLKELKENGDRALALESLLEGEATLVMVRVALADLPGSDESTEEMLGPLLSAGALERSNVPADIPDYFVDQLFFPYVEGTAYVRATVKKGGWPAVDRLWKDPPRSSAAILHPGRALPPDSDFFPRPDGLAPAGMRLSYTDTVGEWGIRFLLRRSLDEDEADAVAAGWRGDRIAFYVSPRAVAYLWRARFDSPAAAERFETDWRKSRGDRNEKIARSGRDLTISSGIDASPKS